ncbi:MAG: biopolymer transporter ExbD [Gemmatimonadota bacterium]|jgi:biopolymer transport protein ExbD
MRNRRDDLPLTADINVTSLVDVAFTLLVIFIITAPVLQGGIEIEPPEADVQPVTAEDHPFFVSVTSDGTVYVEETALGDDFRTALPQLVQMSSPDRVYVRGDAAAAWERMIQVLGILNEVGTPFVVVAEPWTER